jgi:opacity protein-like surface antigen
MAGPGVVLVGEIKRSAISRTTISIARTLGLVLSTSLACAFATGPVLAADYVLPESAPNFNWTGLYVGGDVGYRMLSTAVTISSAAGPLSSPSQSAGGFMGSIVAGYNWQIPSWWNQSILIGAEFDIIGESGKRTNNFIAGAEAFSTSTQAPWLSTARVRLGIPFGPGGSWLAFGTTGIGFGRFETTTTVTGPVAGSLVGSEDRLSWVAGAGFEYALSRYWGWKSEYLYVDTGAFVDTTPALPTGIVQTTKRSTQQILRTGINFHF